MLKLAPVLLEVTQRNQSNSSGGRGSGLIHTYRPTPYVNHPTPVHQSSMSLCVWTFFWLALLLLSLIPAFVACELWILISPLYACCPRACNPLNFLLRIAHFPYTFTRKLIAAEPLAGF